MGIMEKKMETTIYACFVLVTNFSSIVIGRAERASKAQVPQIKLRICSGCYCKLEIALENVGVKRRSTHCRLRSVH